MQVLQAQIKNTREIVLLNKGSSTVVTKGEILMLATGVAVPATSATVAADLAGLCNQTIAAADALTQVETIVISDEDTFLINTANNTNAAHNGQQMVLTDSVTANNTGTTSATGIVVQVAPFGATGDKKILCRFVTL